MEVELQDKITKEVNKLEDWVTKIRRDIHSYPELSWHEHQTSSLIKGVLGDLGIEFTSCMETGVIGLISGRKPGKTIAFRFDMDALEISEETGIDYASRRDGIMHACGHDGHVAIGLGLARVLQQLRDELAGKVKLIFQPAEEDSPGGGGAKKLIEKGVLDNPKVDAIYGLHIWPELPAGTIGTREGPIMAASDPFTIEICGKGAHASKPELSVDPFIIGAQMINALQTIVSRNIASSEQAVVSIGRMEGGSRYNIIPEKLRLEGTVRSFNEKVRQEINQRMRDICENTARAFGGEVKLSYRFGYPATINDPGLVRQTEKLIKAVLGEGGYMTIPQPAATGEDFSYYAQQVPAVYMWLGSKQGEEDTYPLHNARFDFPEKTLLKGIVALAGIALGYSK
ncbi:MAG: M20 family metallopeptidase [Halanaerobium sp.]|nr:M20 family metallopeptidase [Halanaerobium sp.]